MAEESSAQRTARAWPAQLRHLGRFAAPFGRAAVNLVYPPSCVHCRGATAEPHGLCAVCWGSMPFIERPFCERLGTPFPVDYGGPLLSPAVIEFATRLMGRLVRRISDSRLSA